MNEGQPPPKRVRLSEGSLLDMKREELLDRWKLQEDYVNFLENKAQRPSDDDSEEKLRQMHSEFTRKEKIHILRLSTKEQDFQELANKLAEINKGQSPGASQLRSTLLDPALNLLFMRMKKELEDKTKQLQQAQEDMSAWKFTSDSQTGKRLMARCRTLLQENQDLGKQVSSGKIANLDAELAMQKKYNEELKCSQDELYEMVVQLNEEGEGMQSTICALQQQLKDVNGKLSKYEEVQPSAAGPFLDQAPAMTSLDQSSGDTEMTNVERTASLPHGEVGGGGCRNQGAKDPPGINDREESMNVRHNAVSLSEDPVEEPSEKPKKVPPKDEEAIERNKEITPESSTTVGHEGSTVIGHEGSTEISHENDKRMSNPTDPSNNDEDRLKNDESRTTEGGSLEEHEGEEEVSHPARTTEGDADGRTSPLVTETDQQPEEPMETDAKCGDYGVGRTKQSPAEGGEMRTSGSLAGAGDDGRTSPSGDDEDGRTEEPLPMDDGTNEGRTTKPRRSDPVTAQSNRMDEATEGRTTKPQQVLDPLGDEPSSPTVAGDDGKSGRATEHPETQPPSSVGRDAIIGGLEDVSESRPRRQQTDSDGDYGGLDFRTTNAMTPASPSDQSTGDVEMTEPIGDHTVENPGVAEGALLVRTENRTEDQCDPMEKVGSIGKDEISENLNVEKGSFKNDVIVNNVTENDQCPGVVGSDDAKLNIGGDYLGGHDNLKSDNSSNGTEIVDDVGEAEFGESNCIKVQEDPVHRASDPASPENNGEVPALTPLSPQASTEDESEATWPSNDPKPCRLSAQSETVDIVKTTNGVQKGILSKDNVALPLPHSPEVDVNCTSDAGGKDRTNGPKMEIEEGAVPIRTDSPHGREDLTAE